MENQVFLSYKNTKDGIKTYDSDMAQALYDALTREGISTFYASQTLMDLGTDKYKEKIDEELDKCIVLIVVGTSVENINSRWVKYEWDGFYLDILNGKNAKVFTYVDGINPHSLPRALRGVQSFDCKNDSISTVVSFVRNAIAEITGEEDLIISKTKDSSIWNGEIETAKDYSVTFFNEEIKSLQDEDVSVIEDGTKRFSRLYESNHVYKHYNIEEESTDIASTIYTAITEGARNGGTNQLLKIKGPLGSYKNRLLQYVYLNIDKKDKDLLPFYIDITYFERLLENLSSQDSGSIEQILNSHFDTISRIISDNSERIPILILDGIHDFSVGNDDFYKALKKKIRKINCSTIVSLDSDFTNNNHHIYPVHPLAGTDFEHYIRIYSVSLYNKDKSIKFIKNCLDAFNVMIPYDNVDEETIYERMINLKVTALDAYWLSVLLKEMLGNILNERITIADLYEAICKKTLSDEEIDSASQLAYEFEYDSIDARKWNAYADKRWKTICKHRSVLDYLIARYYFLKLEELDVNDDNNIQEQLHFFSMILPKSVTIFVSPMINKIDAYESKVLSIAHNHYANMSVLEKNQLIFWMGRLRNKVSVEESTALLKEYREQQKRQYNEARQSGKDAKKNAFLLRTISVSLMVLGDKAAAEDYLEMLLSDKYTNEVNRAFNLTYYGDKRYIPNKSMLDFDDDLKRGSNTFEVLIASIKEKINKHIFNYMLLLELFTLCSLIQARIEGARRTQDVISTGQYALVTQKYLKWILKQRKLSEFGKLRIYYEWMIEEIGKYYSMNITYEPASAFNNLYSANGIGRSGWIKREIQKPESLAEHMYSCWLIAAMYLPNKSEEKEYNKNKILNMLLIHDLGETSTGDVPRPEKEQHQKYYDDQENSAMNKIIFSGTYPNANSMGFLSSGWEAWYLNEDINSKIARDIDTVQAIYQFCIYYNKNKGLFDELDIQEWLDPIYDLKTEEGRNIASNIIVENSLFKEIMEIWESVNSFE